MHVLPETHDHLPFDLKTKLGKDGFLFYALRAHEAISSLYSYEIDVYTTQEDVAPQSLLGTLACLEIKQNDSSLYYTGHISQIKRGKIQIDDNGIVYQFFTLYLKPKLWQTTLTKDCRIFQNKSALDIVEDLLKEHKIDKIENNVQSAGSAVRDYCVQYNETVYDFIARLLEEEGIFYYFNHSSKGETLVLQDDSSASKKASSDPLIYRTFSNENPFSDSIVSFEEQTTLMSKKLATSDYSPEIPSTPLTDSLPLDEGMGEIFTYPGFYQETSDSEALLTNDSNRLKSRNNYLKIESRSFDLLPGYSINLKDLPLESLNDTYLIVSVDHRYEPYAEHKRIYKNHATLVLLNNPYLPEKKYQKPRLFCPQSALVVGKEKEEIWTDDQGRICVHFYWDRYSKKDENSSCWIRVMQPWAGSGWGVNFIPRIGMEVIVTFLDGDVDRPLVIGCVHNADNPSIYPDSKGTQSGIKTRSTKKKPDGFNELRFEDEKDSEQIFIHAQKDLDTEVENSRTLLIKKGDDTTTLENGNRSVTFSSKDGAITDELLLEEGDRTITLNKGDHTLHVKEGNSIIHIETGDKTITLDKGNIQITLKEGNFLQVLEKGDMKLSLDEGDYTQEIKGKRTLTIKQDESCTNQEGFSRKVTNDYKLSAKNISLDAESEISLNAKTIKLNADEITLSGTQAIKLGSSAGPIEAKALEVKVKADTTLEVKASAQGNVDLGASGMIKTSGTLTVNGGGALTLTGGMVSIG